MDGIADYHFIRLLGSGGRGQVWLARPPARLQVSDDAVAVKNIPLRVRDADARRIAAHLCRYTSVDSPHLVPLYDAGRHDGQLFHASAFQPGGGLAEAASDLPSAHVVRVMAGAARGAHALHEAGIAHRGIKPQNVFVTDDGGMLGDLGLTQLLRPGQTVAGTVAVAALEFLAPEAVGDAAGSRAADIWALGATLHHALTGTSLYPGLDLDDPLASLRHVRSTRPQVDEALPPPLRDVIVACLARDPAQRPRTADDLATRLDVFATPEATA